MPNLEPTSEDIAKLPKWAQNYIYLLRSKADNLQGQLNAHGDPDSPVTWTYGLDGGVHGLPEKATVTLNFGPDRYIQVARRDGVMKVHGSSSISLHPAGASNAVNIYVK